MSTIMVIYCLMALSTVMMQKYTDRPKCSILCSISECSMKWAKYPVALAAQKGMTTVLPVGTPGRHNTHIHEMKMRLVFHNFHLIRPSFVCPTKDRNPHKYYTLVLFTISSASIFFFSGMDVLAGLLPVRTLLILMIMAVSLLVRGYYVREITPQINLLKLVIFLLMFIPSSMATSVYGGLKNNGWLGYTVTISS